MAGYVSRCFFSSADVHLDLKVYVSSLQLRSLHGSPCIAGCYITAQAIDCGVPLHTFARPTSLGVLSGTRLVWDQWLVLPVKVCDLPSSAQLVLRLWGVGNECLAGATVRLFDSKLALRRGLQSVVVWRRGVDAMAALQNTDPEGVRAGELLARPSGGPSASPARALLEQYWAQDTQACAWTDRLLMAQLQAEVASEMVAAEEAARAAAPSPPPAQRPADPQAAAAAAAVPHSPPRHASLGDALVLGTAEVHLPWLDYPIIYGEFSGGIEGAVRGGSGVPSAAAAAGSAGVGGGGLGMGNLLGGGAGGRGGGGGGVGASPGAGKAGGAGGGGLGGGGGGAGIAAAAAAAYGAAALPIGVGGVAVVAAAAAVAVGVVGVGVGVEAVLGVLAAWAAWGVVGLGWGAGVAGQAVVVPSVGLGVCRAVGGP